MPTAVSIARLPPRLVEVFSLLAPVVRCPGLSTTRSVHLSERGLLLCNAAGAASTLNTVDITRACSVSGFLERHTRCETSGHSGHIGVTAAATRGSHVCCLCRNGRCRRTLYGCRGCQPAM